MPAYTGPNNTPVGNIDFIAQGEALSALQRNWQIGTVNITYLGSGGGLATSFSASTIYGVLQDTGSTVTITAGSYLPVYKFATPATFFQMGMPTQYAPPGGPCIATVNTTGLVCTILYK